MPDMKSNECFGKLWDERSPECAGGLDAMYTNPDNGSKMRPQCTAYEACKRQMQAAGAQEHLNAIKARPSQEFRPPSITYSLPPAPPVGSTPLKSGIPVMPSQVSLGRPPVPSIPLAPAPQAQHYPPQTQQPYYPSNHPPFQQQERPAPQQPPPQVFPAVFCPTLTLQPHETPPFLTVPEPILPGESVWKRFLLEALRAALKGIFSHGAYATDHTTIYQSRGK